VMVHWYTWIGKSDDGSNAFAAVRTKIPLMIDGTTSGLDSGTNRGLRDSLIAHGLPHAEIMVTEFNTNGSLQTATYDAAKSIFVADAYASWLELGVTSIQFLEMLTANGDFLGGSGIDRGPAFYGILMVDKLVEPNETLVHATSDNTSLRVHAALQDDGSLAVMLLNLSLSETTDVTVNIAGLSLDGSGIRYSLSGGTNFTQSPVSGLSNSFSANVPARSIAVYHLTPSPGLAGDFDDDGDVDGQDFLEWQRGNSPVPFIAGDLSDWDSNYAIVSSLAAASLVPEPARIVTLFSTSLFLSPPSLHFFFPISGK